MFMAPAVWCLVRSFASFLFTFYLSVPIYFVGPTVPPTSLPFATQLRGVIQRAPPPSPLRHVPSSLSVMHTALTCKVTHPLDTPYVYNTGDKINNISPGGDKIAPGGDKITPFSVSQQAHMRHTTDRFCQQIPQAITRQQPSNAFSSAQFLSVWRDSSPFLAWPDLWV